MDPDLVGAAGLEPELQARRARSRRIEQAPVGDRALAAALHDRHPLAVDGMAAERPVDRAGGHAGHAPDDRLVDPVDRMHAELPGEPDMRAVVLGRHHHPADLAVQPVHDARPQHAADAREAGAAHGPAAH